MNLGSPTELYQQLLVGTSGSVAGALLVSLLLGAVHGASPGHGKTLVVASLLGSQGSLRRVILLAVTVAVTHTVGVLILAAVVLTANDALLPNQITPYITLGADILVVLFGADLVRRALWARSRSKAAADHDHADHADHDHDHADPDHEHPHVHPHPHVPAGLELTRGYTISIGIVGGLVPNGTALIVLLMAIAFHEVALGMLLVATFGLGIALVLGAVGVATVVVRSRGGQLASPGGSIGRVVSLLPLVSGLAVLGVGVVLLATALSAL
jgi:ABC-type nickel/cobalt efflux system permease component RcnA